jgi:glyoxalase family protein
MENNILGIHHITAIAGDAKRNFDFYTKVLGLRFVKRTVNFDDPQTYHFYFGNEQGSPGTILTFFPWGDRVRKGSNGSGMATAIGYAVPEDSLGFWADRLTANHFPVTEGEQFGQKFIAFSDPDGLQLQLIATTAEADNRKPYETDEVKAAVATKGFFNTTLTLNSIKATAHILTEVFGYQLIAQEGNRYRYATDTVSTANVIDLIELPTEQRGIGAGGTIHHIAFRVKDDKTQMAFHDKIQKLGLNITPQIDRNYFHSLYFREPGGVLFEIATDNPGFTVDEPLEELGTHLKLPVQYEEQRSAIEKHLVPLD